MRFQSPLRSTFLADVGDLVRGEANSLTDSSAVESADAKFSVSVLTVSSTFSVSELTVSSTFSEMLETVSSSVVLASLTISWISSWISSSLSSSSSSSLNSSFVSLVTWEMTLSNGNVDEVEDASVVSFGVFFRRKRMRPTLRTG